MRIWNVLLVLIGFLLGAAALKADEDIFLRGKEKPTKGVIKSESPRGIVVGKDSFAAEEIVDVKYELAAVGDRIALYTPAITAEKASLDPAQEANRKKLLGEAVKKYQETFAKVGAAEKNAKRHLEYKVASLLVRQVQEDGAAPDEAIKKLKSFAANHAGGWQISHALISLGRLQLDAGDNEGAEASFQNLAALDVSEDTKLDAELMAVQVGIKNGKHAESQKKLQEIEAKLPKGSRFAARARVAQAECLVAAKKLDEAETLVRSVIKDTTDKQVKAVAHNTLGVCYFNNDGRKKEAMWEFLWVDVVYNQDKVEHAKALYHLWKIFTELGEAERAQECRETLLTNPQFAGLEYQRMAQRESKTP